MPYQNVLSKREKSFILIYITCSNGGKFLSTN